MILHAQKRPATPDRPISRPMTQPDAITTDLTPLPDWHRLTQAEVDTYRGEQICRLLTWHAVRSAAGEVGE